MSTQNNNSRATLEQDSAVTNNCKQDGWLRLLYLSGMMQVQLLSEEHGRKDYAVVFRNGDEAISGLTEFAEQYDVKSAHFTAIGMFQQATLGSFSIEQKSYKKIPIEGPVEVASMTGDIALLNSKPVVHSHAVVSFPDGTTRAGHVLEGHVRATLEVMITVEPNAMHKRFEPETGLALIDPSLANEHGFHADKSS